MKKTATPPAPPANSRPIFGSFTERGLSNVPMKPGTNVRVFNSVLLDAGDYIKYDQGTGYLTLQPGVYRFDGWSLTTPGYLLKRSQMLDLYSAPGYAFLWNVDEKKIEALASLQDPMYSLPSNLNAVVKVTRPTQFYFGHQNGNTVTGYFLQTYDPEIKMPDGTPSTNHAFAQLIIQRL